eukprot:361368-Chlamydomonas_euryale.AAC.2
MQRADDRDQAAGGGRLVAVENALEDRVRHATSGRLGPGSAGSSWSKRRPDRRMHGGKVWPALRKNAHMTAGSGRPWRGHVCVAGKLGGAVGCHTAPQH